MFNLFSLAELPKIMDTVKTEFEKLESRVTMLESKLESKLDPDSGVGTGGTGVENEGVTGHE